MKYKNQINKKGFIEDDIATSRLIIASIIGFVLGLFGIHDFIVRRYTEGLAHILLCVITAIIAPFTTFLGALAPATGPNIMGYIFYTPFLIAGFSYIWGVIESIKFIIIADKRQRIASRVN